ncbi:hypothetical protein G4B88_028302 [Cannabis sativa]|uniref:Aminotransferase-like plant mobile domain-containing protein n=1 Tax=Cannabis sativa TaxID=3483 RepID=A0A7J6FCL8_CANSA|nr:hypothetical protein G4B88_028302 [Cannabis sativa]
MGKRKKTFSNSESLPQSKNNIFPCEHSMAPPLRRDLFPRILETDGIYLYQDSMNDYIVPDRDLLLCYRYSKNDLAVEYRSCSGVIQGWKSKATHTFIVNWGEFTITLEDVYALLLLPICGTTSLVSPLSNDEQSLLSSLPIVVEDLKKRYIFPSKTSRRTVQSTVFLLACRLAYGKHFPLGAAYLGTLYHNLDSVITDANSYSENKEIGDLEKVKQSCLLGSFQLSKRSPDTFRLPGKEREGGVSVKFANIWMRHHCIGLISRGEACDREKDVCPLSGMYVPSQKSPPLAPSEAPSKLCLVHERHTPANLNIGSIEDDVMVALVGKSSDALGGNSYGNDVVVRPNSEPRPFHCSGTNGDSDATTNLPPILKKLIESYLETVRSSIRHRQLVEELNTLHEARKVLDHKIENLAEHIRDRAPPPSTWTHENNFLAIHNGNKSSDVNMRIDQIRIHDSDIKLAKH